MTTLETRKPLSTLADIPTWRGRVVPPYLAHLFDQLVGSQKIINAGFESGREWFDISLFLKGSAASCAIPPKPCQILVK